MVECCHTNTHKGNAIFSMLLRCLNGDKMMQSEIKTEQYVTPLNATLLPNTAYTIIPQTVFPC